jgi:GNAT superfamily N-acetyltransferase
MAVSVQMAGDAPNRSMSFYRISSTNLAVIDCSEISFLVDADNDAFYVNRVSVPKTMQGGGCGVELMSALAEIADKRRLVLFIDPTANYGSDVARLTEFFSRFGFRPSESRQVSFGSMIREPQ